MKKFSKNVLHFAFLFVLYSRDCFREVGNMRYRKLLAAAIAAVMVLSGCNADKPVETSAVTEEVTTTTTVESTTTPAVTLTSSEPDDYGELKSYPVRDDQVLPIFDKRSLEIFESVFYGVWDCENEKVYPDELHLTYSEDFFDYGHACYPCNIVETDELYALTYINGGEPSCYTVFKNEPDVLYDCGYNLYNGNLEGNKWAVYINARAPKYTDRAQTYMPYMHAGKLSNLGQHRLFYELGEDFAEFYDETLLNDEGYNGESFDGSGYIDKNGTSWRIVSSMAYPRDTRYLVSYDNYIDEPSVTVGMPYYEKNEYEAHDFLGDGEEVSWKKYFALEFTKTGEKWQVTHRPLEEVYEEFDTLTFEAPEAQNRMLASVVCNNVKKVYGKYSFPEAKVIVTDAKTGEKLGFTDYSTAMTGLDYKYSDGDIAVRIYSVKPDHALIVAGVPFLKLRRIPMYLVSFYWCDRGTVKYLDMAAPNSEIEINSLDDISLSGNEVIYVTDSIGTEMRFVVDRNGYTVHKCDDMGLTATDKTKVYEFPIQKFSDDEVELVCGEVKPAEELVEFNSYNSIEEEWDTFGAGKFLDDLGIPELKKLYYSGKFIASMPVSFFIPYADGYNGMTYFRGAGDHYESDAAAIKVPFGNTGNKATFYASGFTCDSFLAAFPKIFTEEWKPVMLNNFHYFIKYGEELYYAYGEVGGNLAHLYTEYELVKQTDNEIIFNAIAYDLDWRESLETPEAVYDPAKKDDYLKAYQVFRFVKTADGWRIAYSTTGWDWY